MEASVSVIIPCYNSSKTVGRAVQSVIKQTLRPAEILLVNDGSEDNTLKILLELQSLYGSDWIKVISLEQNSGVSIARNTAWNLASQEYIALLDSDEAWHPDKVNFQYSWMRDNPDVLLSGHKLSLIMDSNELILEPIPNDVDAILISKKKLLLIHQFPTSSVMFRREIQYRFNDKKRRGEDTLLWLSIVLSNHKAFVLNVALSYRFKYNYGDVGLSGNMWKMEQALQNNFLLLFKDKKITFMQLCFASLWSLLKYLWRLISIKLNLKMQHEINQVKGH